MMNKIWGGMVIVSLIVSCFTGKIEETASAAVSGAGDAVTLSISLLGIMCLWTGIAKIGEEAGLIKITARLLCPVLRPLFPDLKTDGTGFGCTVLNIVANLLGMGNAATPLGINAVREIKKEQGLRDRASNELCMLVVLNTASLQLIPTTPVSLRQQYGAASPGDVIPAIWICELCALTAGIIMALSLRRFFKKKEAQIWN